MAAIKSILVGYCIREPAPNLFWLAALVENQAPSFQYKKNKDTKRLVMVVIWGKNAHINWLLKKFIQTKNLTI